MGSQSTVHKTSVWGLGSVWKRFSGKANSEEYRLFLCEMTHVRVVKQWKLEKSACVTSHGITLSPSHRLLLLSPLVPSLTMKPLCLNHLSCFTTSLIYCYGIRQPNSLWFRVTTLYYLLVILSFGVGLLWGDSSAGLTWGHACRCYHLESQTELEHPEWHHLHARTSAGIAGTVGSWLGISFSVSLRFSKQNRWISWHSDPWPPKHKSRSFQALLRLFNSAVFHWLKHITSQPRLKKRNRFFFIIT